MKLKIILFFATLWSFGDYKIGVQCIDEQDLAEFNRARHEDLMDFVRYNANDFDTFNRECMLAGLVRLAMGSEFNYSSDNLPYFTMVIRLISPENQKYLGVELANLLSAIKKSFQKEGEIKKTALAVIKKGLEYNIWYTEKEMEIINEFRYSGKKSVGTKSMEGFKTCLVVFGSITLPNSPSWLDNTVSEKFIKENGAWSNYLSDFKQITLLFSNNLEVMDYEANSRKTVFEVMQSALVDVLRGMIHVLYNTKFTEALEQELSSYPNGTSVHTELLVILQHMYTEVVETAKEAYIVQVLNGYSGKILQNEYDIFATIFQAKWIFLFPQFGETFVKTPMDAPFTELPNIRPFLIISRHHNKDCAGPQCVWCNPSFSSSGITITISPELDQLIEKEETTESPRLEKSKSKRRLNSMGRALSTMGTRKRSASRREKDVEQQKQKGYMSVEDQRETSTREENCEFLEYYYHGKTKMVSNGRLVKNQKVSLPIFQYFKKFNESWMNKGPNMDDQQQMKNFLLQLSVWQKIIHSNIQYMLQLSRLGKKGGPKFLWDHWLFSGLFDVLSTVAQTTGLVSTDNTPTTVPKCDQKILQSFAIDKNFMDMFVKYD